MQICPTCGKSFNSKRSSHRIYCSLECVYKDSEHGNRISKSKHKEECWETKVCPTCGNSFNSKKSGHRIYCSISCINKGKQHKESAWETKICPICGKTIKSLICEHRICCSRECDSKNKHKEETWIIQVCPTCGKSFKSRKSNPKKHCSYECRTKNNWITKICPVCKKHFKSRVISNRKYCSLGCRNKDIEWKGKIGKAHIGKRYPRKEDIWIAKVCPICGKTFDSYICQHKKYCSRGCSNISSEHWDKVGKAIKSNRQSPESKFNSKEYIDKNNERLRNMICKRPTKPQTKLLLIEIYLHPNETIIFEQPVDGTGYSIDVAFPKSMCGFEYDEPHFHKNNPWRDTTKKEKIRHKTIESLGWFITHYFSEKELNVLVPPNVWHKINDIVKKSTVEERRKMIIPYMYSNQL